MKTTVLRALTAALCAALLAGCAPAGDDETKEEMSDEIMVNENGKHVIYFAAGCFWGTEKLFESIDGVTDAVSGYANGSGEADANYPAVCTGATGFRETVRVEYDPLRVSLDKLIFAFFGVVDPTLKNQQGNDIGSQYQAGIYYSTDEAREAALRIADIERARAEPFNVEIKPLENFFAAEEYHQDYLDKNPGGYCHISPGELAEYAGLVVDPGDYKRPDDAAIAERLTAQQYDVTQRGGTERAFDNEYWDNFDKGIYVDIVTGEPLFTSLDKYESSCGWPAFSRPVEEPVVSEREDSSFGMRRTEALSRAGNSHLGHVFFGDSESPTGTRYCIDSASLRFIPYGEMEAEGYGYLMYLFD